MFSKKDSVTRNIRLPKQSAIPGYEDIEFLLEEAGKTPGRIVELPWSLPNSKDQFILSIKYESRDAEPFTVLYKVSESGQQLAVWSHQCRDVPLLANLIASSSNADILQDIVPTSRLTGRAPDAQKEKAAAAIVPGITFEPPAPGVKAQIEGDLKNLAMPNLLQSINLSKMTGRLDVKTLSDSATLYFQDGIPLHCALNNTMTSDIAFCELLTWLHGEFRFWQDEKSLDRTITKRFENLMAEDLALLDQTKYLETAGLKLESCLVKKNAMISEDEFAARVGKGTPLAVHKQLDFYELIDNRTSLFGLLRNRPMPKTQWVPILFNLVSCGLVQLTDQAPANTTQNRLAKLKSLGVDEAAVQSVLKNLLRTETGILTYPAFIYLLDQEYLRYEHFNLPFSLVIFSMGQRKSDGRVEPLQMVPIRRAMQRISLVKRAVDMLAHYETNDYSMLLPNTNSTAASALANRIADVLREAPLSSDMDSRSLALAFGVATVPEDCQELDKVVLLARNARDRSKFSQQRVVLAREIMTQAPS